MPAQWPIFINNVSKKLASRTSKGPDDFGMFVANEYFNAVKTITPQDIKDLANKYFQEKDLIELVVGKK